MSGGIQTSEVTMRKRTENRIYTEENIRDSIVIGELSSKFPDFGKLQWFGSLSNDSRYVWTKVIVRRRLAMSWWGWWLAGSVLLVLHRMLTIADFVGAHYHCCIFHFPPPFLPFTNPQPPPPPLLCLPLSALSSLLPLLTAPSGGFSYSGMQSSPQSPLGYSLPQVSRARNQSSDVSEALYNLDRVLHGKSAAYMPGWVCWLCWTVHPSLVFWMQLWCVLYIIWCV